MRAARNSDGAGLNVDILHEQRLRVRVNQPLLKRGNPPISRLPPVTPPDTCPTGEYDQVHTCRANGSTRTFTTVGLLRRIPRCNSQTPRGFSLSVGPHTQHAHTKVTVVKHVRNKSGFQLNTVDEQSAERVVGGRWANAGQTRQIVKL